jgi:hypothetical protein
MICRGVTIPLIAGHIGVCRAGFPGWIDRYAVKTLGEVVLSRLEHDSLWLLFDIPPTALDTLRVRRFVSPEIAYDHRDQDGVLYSGASIVHVAATATPVLRDQQPFEIDPAPRAVVRL